MKFWINTNSNSDNVVILTKNGVLVASCNEYACDAIREKLAANVHPISIYAKDDIHIVKSTQLRSVTSRNTDTNIDLCYRVLKKKENLPLNFQSTEQKQEFTSIFNKIAPENLKKTEHQQRWFTAILPSLFSLFFALFISWFYINKWRWVTLIVGGLWALASIYILITRVKTPPKITRWSPKDQYVKKGRGAINTGFSYAVATLMIMVFSFKLPLVYGAQAILDNLDHDTLTAGNIEELVSKGANINVRNEYGDSPLHYAVGIEDYELVEALLQQGANPAQQNGEGETALEQALQFGDMQSTNLILQSVDSLDDHNNIWWAVSNAGPPAEIMDLIVARGFDIHTLSEHGDNLLKAAIESGTGYTFVNYLLGAGVSTDFTIDDMSPAEYAKETAQSDIAKLLEESSPSVAPN
ncbi:ankyrin repeat domain-containing protein [Teredinibacter haidensis]|uniref:ankyrin repeat domain-containing protein n=1 Tax=Teredinibacter haidensis TaxID=2731755 RepID=UPI00094906DE|nr:ankyrin repeat domain-containing protein [Teredinibacter haidensis]